MTESRESGPERNTAAMEPRAVESAPPYDARSNRSTSNLVRVGIGVGIVAGVVFIVAVIFFAGFVMGGNSYGNFGGGHHHPGMMAPSQSGPHRQMGPGMMGPGGMTGPYGPWPGPQSPTTAVPAIPRP